MLSVCEIYASMRNRDLKSYDVVSECLNTIKDKNTTLNAFCDVYEEESLSAAKQLDKEAESGLFRGPLHGIPVGVKDLFFVRGKKTARGSAAFADFLPLTTAPIVERLESAGAVVLGKTTTTEFGWSGSSVSDYYGPTKNPWNSNLTSGGSSSGSAAAVASGMVPFTLGSDGGGSVRIPASFCGHFALKGSLGRIPTYPWSATEMLSHAGPMTTNVKDSIFLFDILKGPDARDHNALPEERFKYMDTIWNESKFKVAYAPSLFGVQVDSEVKAVIQDGIDRIEQVLKIECEVVNPDWKDPIDIFETLWVAGRGVAYGSLVGEKSHKLGRGFKHLIQASQKISLADYLDAMRRRSLFSTKVHEFFENYDFLLLPTVPILPFDAALEAPDERPANSENLSWTGWTPFTYPFNISGNPAASIPAGISRRGLPVGMQVVGPRHMDHRVLAFCRVLEDLGGFTVLDRMPQNC